MDNNPSLLLHTMYTLPNTLSREIHHTPFHRNSQLLSKFIISISIKTLDSLKLTNLSLIFTPIWRR